MPMLESHLIRRTSWIDESDAGLLADVCQIIYGYRSMFLKTPHQCSNDSSDIAGGALFVLSRRVGHKDNSSQMSL